MRVMYDNHVFDETVAASTEDANFPLTNITTSRVLSDVFKMTATSGTITVTGSSLRADYACIIGCNATSASVNGEAFACTGGVDLIYFTSSTTTTWTFTFSGSANIEIAGLWIGEYTQMPIMNPGQTIVLSDADRIDTSLSGQVYIYELAELRLKEYLVQFPYMTTEQKEELEAYWLSWAHRQVIVDVWEESNIQDPFYAYQTLTPIQISRTGSHNQPWSSNLIFRETK